MQLQKIKWNVLFPYEPITTFLQRTVWQSCRTFFAPHLWVKHERLVCFALCLQSPVSSYHHSSFNMEIRASPAAGLFFLPSLGLCGARVNTFNWLGAPVCGAFVMPMKQSELSLHQFGWAADINQNSSGLPQITHPSVGHQFLQVVINKGGEIKKESFAQSHGGHMV